VRDLSGASTLDPILSFFFFFFFVVFFSSLVGGSLVLLFYLNSTEHSKNKQTDKREKKKKEKMASQRPWRSAGFDALRRDYKGDNNDDECAGAHVSGISVDFTPPPPSNTPTGPTMTAAEIEKQRYYSGVRSYSDKDHENAKAFLRLLAEMRTMPSLSDNSSTPFHLELNLVLKRETAWGALKTMMYNFFGDTSFKRNLALTGESHLKEVVTGILQRKFDRIKAEFAAFDIEEGFQLRNLPQGETGYVPEQRESQLPINTFELKGIIDAINVATANIKNASRMSVSNVAMYEPPFYPRLSEDERMMVWNWVNVKQAAVEEIYKDKFYQFATTVAGMVNLNDFGLDKLITSAFKQTPRYREYQEMPSTIADDPFLSAERDALFAQIVDLNTALQQSKVRDGLRMQRTYNRIAEINGVTEGDEEILQDQAVFERIYKARGNEIPTIGAEIYDMNIEAPKSEMTRQLELRVKALEGLSDAFTSENSRQRMLSAVKWMMQPETLKKAEMQPIFSAAIQQALFRVRSMVPSLQNVTDAKMFYESPDGMVVTAFAELVAQQITRTQFFHQTRVMLDKTHSRNQQMENRLKWTMRNFRFDGTHVLSRFSDTSSSSGTCNALYAF
jgi:hypothetical protein